MSVSLHLEVEELAAISDALSWGLKRLTRLVNLSRPAFAERYAERLMWTEAAKLAIDEALHVATIQN